MVDLDQIVSYIRFLGDIFQILDGIFGRVVYKEEGGRRSGEGRRRAGRLTSAGFSYMLFSIGTMPTKALLGKGGRQWRRTVSGRSTGYWKRRSSG